jgi:2'-5' RNA ligase superfamily
MRLVDRILLYGAIAAVLVMGVTIRSRNAKAVVHAAPPEQNNVTAIDTLLDPDETMIKHATEANARLRESYPKGYTLGGAHAPHITLLQRYVKTSDLDHLYAAVDEVFATEDPKSWKLKGIKFEYFPDKTIGLANIVVQPTPDLLRLQQKLIDAEKPFEVPTGTDAAFVITKEDPSIIPQLLPYVADFVPKYSGNNYFPHVTIGVGTAELCEKMKSEPFDTFTFSPVGASTYHLGNWGTAMKKLHSYKLK